MKSTKRLLAVGVAASVALLSFVGVADAAPKPDPVAQALAAVQAKMVPPKTITQKIPLRVKPRTGLTVIMLNPGISSSNQQALATEAAAKRVGWNFEQILFSTANLATLQSGLLNALAKKPAAVIVAGSSQEQVQQGIVDQYLAAKIPIIISSQCPFTQKAPFFGGASLCKNTVPQGITLADWFIADSKGKGHALFQSMPSYQVLTIYREAFLNEVKAKCPACTVDVIETTLAQFASNQIPSAVVNKVRSDPSIKYVFFDSGVWANGILPAMDAAGLLGKVAIGGRGMEAAQLAALQGQQMEVWEAIPYTVWGYANFDSVLRVVTKSSGINNNDIQPFQVVTNLNASTVTIPFIAPADALNQYAKLWRVP